MALRIAVAGFNPESVSAVPQRVELAESQRVCTRAAEIPARLRGTNTAAGGCIAICDAEGAEFVPRFHGSRGSLGPANGAAVGSRVRAARAQSYVKAAQLPGTPAPTRIMRHLMPATIAPLIVQATHIHASAIPTESALSLSWGNIMVEGQLYFAMKPWRVCWPAIVLSPCILSINLPGDARRNRLGPKMKGRGDIAAGETVWLVGESGSGKSVTGDDGPAAEARAADHRGSVLLNGEDILTAPPARTETLRGADMAMIFQETMTALNPVLQIKLQMDDVCQTRRRMRPAERRRGALDRFAPARLPASPLIGAGGVPGCDVKIRQWPNEKLHFTRDDRIGTFPFGDTLAGDAGLLRLSIHRAHPPATENGVFFLNCNPQRQSWRAARRIDLLQIARYRGFTGIRTDRASEIHAKYL